MNPSDAIPLQSFEQWEAPLDILMREMQPGIGNRESTSTQSNPSGVDSDENARNGISSLCDPFRKLIEEMVAKNLNEKGIWQDLVHDHGFQGKYWSVRRYEKQMRENILPVNDLEFPTKIMTTYALWVSHLDVIGLNDGSVDELPPDLFTIVPRCRSEWGTAIDQSKRNQFQHNPKWSLCKSHISFVHTARIVSIAIRTNCSHHFE